MFYHAKELQFNVRVSQPDPAFARLLLEQFGGANGELAAAMRYFMQAFSAKQPYPDKYDMLMDIATEEFSHLEIVGATIQLLLKGVNGDLKDAAENSEIMETLNGKAAKENLIHGAMMNPQFLVNSAGGPILSDSNGNPWTAAFINGDAQGDLTSDLRSDMAAEVRAKMVYEYLMQFTNDPYVKETLMFLMTREVAHYQMFEAALETIKPNFPPGTLESDPRYSNKYFDLSNGTTVRGPWNEGLTTKMGETWQFIEKPVEHVVGTKGLTEEEIEGTERTMKSMKKHDEELGEMRSKHVVAAQEAAKNKWNPMYPEEVIIKK
ncbi:MAG TPA: manganese catalase family protein [Patescibacteria group bacterium]|nr:manganese catalase family protein [Patescibacteria group bacterium]